MRNTFHECHSRCRVSLRLSSSLLLIVTFAIAVVLTICWENYWRLQLEYNRNGMGKTQFPIYFIARIHTGARLSGWMNGFGRGQANSTIHSLMKRLLSRNTFLVKMHTDNTDFRECEIEWASKRMLRKSVKRNRKLQSSKTYTYWFSSQFFGKWNIMNRNWDESRWNRGISHNDF